MSRKVECDNCGRQEEEGYTVKWHIIEGLGSTIPVYGEPSLIACSWPCVRALAEKMDKAEQHA